MRKLKEKLNAKLSKNGGFTLVEMLIVVAIIAILIAISIPMVSSSLEKARLAVDRANARSAIGLASIEVLSAEPNAPITDKTKWTYAIAGNNQGVLKGENEEGVLGQSKDVKNEKLVVTYHLDTNGEYFETSFDEIIKDAISTGAGGTSTP